MIELRSVKKIYTTKIGETAALDGVSLTFPNKGLIFITGKSGSGKTTMLNVIGGLDGFDDGEIIIDGRSFKDLSAKDYDSYRNTFIGVVFQEYNLLPEYTVEKNIKIATELQGIDATEEEIDVLLEQVEILEYKKRLPSQLSGGQMQRVAIARALIKDPHIILADEPTGALDSNTGIQVIETLKKLSEEKLVIIVSHDLELAEKYADRIISLKDGKVISDQTVSDVVVEGGIYEGENFCVKSGAKLTEEEGKKLIKAVEDGRKIEITKNLKIREKRATTEVKESIKKTKERELVSSKMKFKSSAWLGLKSLSVKPVRLIITILLAVIAFGLFGIIDSVATYDRQKIIYYNLKQSGFNAIVSSAKYVTPYGDTMNMKFTDEAIEQINADTGYKFKGVHYLDDRGDTTARVAGKHTITELAGYSTAVRQAYYHKFFNGQIEFDSSKIYKETDADGNVTEYITENDFNYKILYGTFPNNKDAYGNIDESKVNQVGISSYLAECILQYCGQREFGKSRVFTISDLVGKSFTLDNGRVYTINCIIDCGEIPAKYNILKNDENGKYQNEFLAFLYSGTYFNIFTDTGHFDYHLKKFNTIKTYRMPSGTGTIKINEISTTKQTKNEWYNISDIPNGNYLTFAESSTKIENGVEVKGNVEIGKRQVLIDAKYLASLFSIEYDKLWGLEIREELNNYINVILDKEVKVDNNIIKKPPYTFAEKRSALTTFIRTLENYKLPDGITGSLLGQTITHKKATIEQTFESYPNKDTVSFDIVGVYFGVNTDVTPSNWILAVRQADMEDFSIYPEQGFYTRIVTPVISSSYARSQLAKMMCREEGVVFDWYNNTVISMLETFKEQIEPFFRLFFYLDLVIAIFAVFMLTNYISTSIIQKKQTIGILRALGSGGKDIFIIFIIESLLIAVINGIFAAVFGFLGCIFVNTFVRSQMMINVSFAIFELRQILIIFFSSVITAILASLIPIIRICKRKPVELIRKSY